MDDLNKTIKDVATKFGLGNFFESWQDVAAFAAVILIPIALLKALFK